MIEIINNLFGIKNEVSVPLLISLIVFITGGTTNVFFKWNKTHIHRKKTRKMVISLIGEVKDDLEVKEKQMKVFNQTISLKHNGNWSLEYQPIGYLNILFDLNFNEIFNSFENKKFKNFLKKKTKSNSFHKMWNTLRFLKFTDDELKEDLEKLYTQFSGHQHKYNQSLNEYYKFRNASKFSMDGILKTEKNADSIEYLIRQEKIWSNWLKIKEEDRIAYNVTFNKIILPLYELNNEFYKVKFSRDSIHTLLDCIHQHAEMENLINFYNSRFKILHESYRDSKIILEECILNLK